jgi:predicted lysophospholipase L1 biosynthesis ABC-type transport system permease subunit
VIALYAFAAVLALAGVLIIGQALGRQLFLASSDDRTLSALGVSRRQRFELGVLRAAPTALVAGVVAAIVAVAVSPVMPVGLARTAEPDRGVSFDAVVVLLGAIGVVAVLLAVAAYPAWRLARRAFTEELVEQTRVTPRLAERLARLGAPPTAVAGTRFALEPGHGSTTVPTRSVLVGVAAAGTALVTAVVIAANLNHVVDTPTQWGATWDVTARVAADERELENLIDLDIDIEGLLAAKQDFVETELDKSRVVDTWSVAASSSVDIGGKAIPSLGVDRRGGVDVAVVDGRLPRTTDEVALGGATMDALGLEIGDTARAQGHDLLVVGESVLPRFQTLGGADEAALNRGAVLTLHGIASRSPDFHTRSYLVRLRDGVSPEAGTKALRTAIPETFAFNIERVDAPEDIEALANVTNTPIVLAAVLGVLALATLAHALVTSVRRRRRDLAILVALGFTRRQLRAQVSATVAWQATIVTFVALVFAIPLGIAFGRLLSDVFEESIGTIPEVVVPGWPLVLLVPVALLAANVIAFVPGRLAARTRPTVALRSE